MFLDIWGKVRRLIRLASTEALALKHMSSIIIFILVRVCDEPSLIRCWLLAIENVQLRIE